MATVLIPLPAQDFDPTEVAVSWKVLRAHGHTVLFATPEGLAAEGDELMVTGRGLDPWSRVPALEGLVAVGALLRANYPARQAYAALVEDANFRAPMRWRDARAGVLDGLVLPGGHRARGMRLYLESDVLQELVVDCFTGGMAVGAICHGVLLAARSIDPSTGRSVLYGRRTTALTWTLERSAWALARRTRSWDPDYYRTYTEEPGQAPGFMSVQQEVTRALAVPEDFRDVEGTARERRRMNNGWSRDSMIDPRPAWVVRDGSYVSARWPGDVHTFAHTFAGVLHEQAGVTRP
jgi:putative intracellular protease/amidase